MVLSSLQHGIEQLLMSYKAMRDWKGVRWKVALFFWVRPISNSISWILQVDSFDCTALRHNRRHVLTVRMHSSKDQEAWVENVLFEYPHDDEPDFAKQASIGLSQATPSAL